MELHGALPLCFFKQYIYLNFTLNETLFLTTHHPPVFLPPQPVFLADFKQIKKVQCWPQNDGKALVHLDIQGARQVRTAPPSPPLGFFVGFFFHIEVAASRFVTLQRLSINVAAVSTAENMMDLIDGYCRLEHDTDETVIYRPNKGASGLDCLLYQQNPS